MYLASQKSRFVHGIAVDNQLFTVIISKYTYDNIGPDKARKNSKNYFLQ